MQFCMGSKIVWANVFYRLWDISRNLRNNFAGSLQITTPPGAGPARHSAERTVPFRASVKPIKFPGPMVRGDSVSSVFDTAGLTITDPSRIK